MKHFFKRDKNKDKDVKSDSRNRNASPSGNAVSLVNTSVTRHTDSAQTAGSTELYAQRNKSTSHGRDQIPRSLTPPICVPEDSQGSHTIRQTNVKPASTVSTSQRIWNEAYDSLASSEQTQDLVQKYNRTLSTVLSAERSGAVNSGTVDVTAEMNDPVKRQLYMKRLVEQGQVKVAKVAEFTEKIGSAIEFIDYVRGAVDLAVQSSPMAALPWAGVCIGLEILMNPIKAQKSHVEGTAYVVSKMGWYCALTEHLLDQANVDVGTESYDALQQHLETSIVELFKTLLIFQMKSACTYYRNQGLTFLRGFANLDDWDSDLKAVTDAEAIVQTESDNYLGLQTRTHLRSLVSVAEEKRSLLGDIRMDLKDYITSQMRLQISNEEKECLRDLFVVDPRHTMTDIEAEKDRLVHDAYKWILDTNEYVAFTKWQKGDGNNPMCRLLWIKGEAGTGKTMLLIGIIRQLSDQLAAYAPHLAYCFCQGTENKNANTATAILRSLIWLLLFQQPRLRSHLTSQYEYKGKLLFEDQNSFTALADVFTNMLSDEKLTPVYLVIDALDECSARLGDLLNLIAKTLNITNKVKWLVSGRPEIDLGNLKNSGHMVELDTQLLKSPVNAYISYKLAELGKREDYDDETLQQVSSQVQQKAQNTFLWVALVFKELKTVSGWDAVETIEKMPPSLSKLYDHIMTKIETEKKADFDRCTEVLVAVFLAYRPLSLPELAVIASLPGGSARLYVKRCRSFLTIRQSDGTIHLIHQSANDYLKTNFAAKLNRGEPADVHLEISSRSMNAISKLTPNIYGSLKWGSKAEDVPESGTNLLESLPYSFAFWAQHLQDAATQKSGNDAVLMTSLAFLKDHFCTWLEGLSLLHMLADGILSIRKLIQANHVANSQFGIFMVDAERFSISHISIIERIPLQVYASALAFSPKNSTVRSLLWEQRCPTISDVRGIREEWDSCLQVLEGHQSGINTVAFSLDGRLLATCSNDQTIRLWDSDTGRHRGQLLGHSGYVLSVAFSPDSKKLASCSSDRTVRIWDLETQNFDVVFTSDTHWVNAVSYSNSGSTLVGAGHDHSIHLWNTITFCNRVLQGHKDSINDVAFSPDDKCLVSASSDHSVIYWDLTSGTTKAFDGHLKSVSAVTFSPDGESFASASADSTVKLWNVSHGLKQTFTGHSECVNAIGFSSDGKVLASSSSDRTVRLWDVSTGMCQRILEGHQSWVNSIAFSPVRQIIASASSDRTVRLWSVDSGARKELDKGHDRSVNVVAFSPDGSIFASGSSDRTVRLWNGGDGSYRTTLRGHDNYVLAMAFTSDSKVLATGSSDKSIRLWNTDDGSAHQIRRYLDVLLEGHQDHVLALCFSPDDSLLVSASSDWRLRIWDIRSGECLQILEGHRDWVDKIAFAPNGKKIVSASRDGMLRLWVPALGPKDIEKLNVQQIKKLVFPPGNGGILALIQDDDLLDKWDGKTFDFVSKIMITEPIRKLLFSIDNQYLEFENHKVDLDALAWGTADTAYANTLSESTALAQNPASGFSLPQSDSNEPTWTLLEGHLSKVFSAQDVRRAFDMRTYMQVYTAIHNYCTSQKAISYQNSSKTRGAHLLGGDLYMLLKAYITAYLEELVRVSSTFTEDTWLEFYVQEWTHYNKVARYVHHIFRFLNRHWIKRELDEGQKDVYDVYTLHLVLWQDVFYKVVSAKVVGVVLDLINQQRNSSVINYGLIKQFMDSLTSVQTAREQYGATSKGTTSYRDDVEVPFLEATQQFYDDESSKLMASVGVSEYMKIAEARLNEEVERARTYLHARSEGLLQTVCYDTLISKYTSSFLAEFPILLEKHCENDMKRMYKLFSRIDKVELLTDQYESQIRAAGLASIMEADSDIDKLEPRVFIGSFGDKASKNEISLDAEWIYRGGEHLIWLPPDYRATCATFHDDRLVLGHRSGQVTFLKLDLS